MSGIASNDSRALTPVEAELPKVVAKSSYGQILKTSALIGGSSIIDIVLRIVRTKVLALLLGPSGFGLVGIYSSITQVAATVATMGIQTSGVRTIAEAASSGDDAQMARTTFALRRVALILGLCGTLGLLFFAQPISWLTFGDFAHGRAVAILSLTVLLGVVFAGHQALIQGMRRIPDLAALNVTGAVLGTVFGILIIFVLGERGIVPFLVISAAASTLAAWWFARRIIVPHAEIGWTELRGETQKLLQLGIVFMSSGLMSTGVAYVTRVILVRQLGIDAAGYYQAAWTLSALYVGFVLQAMGSDFFPRLTAAKDHARTNQLVNEQVEVGLLLATPGILATLTFAPLVIQMFYSGKFDASVEVLRWQILGVLLRVASWPMGYVQMAQGRSRLFFWTELISHGLHLGLIWMGIKHWGLLGAGIAFFILYAFYWCLMYGVVRKLTDFKWSAANMRLALIILPATLIVFVSRHLLPGMGATVLGGLVTIGISVYSLFALHSLIGRPGVPDSWGRFRKLWGDL